MSKRKEHITLTIFKNNDKEESIVRHCAFMKCPYCANDIFLMTDKITFCKSKCKKWNKWVYKLRENNQTPEGFDKVLSAEVQNFKEKTLMEAL